MSDTRSPFDPANLGDEAVVEALSALLDDELDDWAADHGLDPVEARRALEATEFAERRTTLAAARAAVRTAPTAPLDDVTRRRLLRTAVQETSPAQRVRTSWYQRPLAGVAAAVVVLVVVGGGLFAVLRDTDGDRRDTSRVATGESDRATTFAEGAGSAAYAGDLGDVSDPSTLRARIEGDPRVSAVLSTRSGAATGKSSTPPSAPPAAPASTSAPTPSTASGATTTTMSGEQTPSFDVAGAPESTRRCLQTVAQSQPAGELLLVGDASYNGSPAVVIVVRQEGRVTTYVSDQRTCAILASQSAKLP